MRKTLQNLVSKNILYVAWLQAFIAMIGSLYFSEVLGFAPCSLCWYQRILIYPLVIILGVGILKKDRHLPSYVLPFSVLGILLSFYHFLLQKGIIPVTLVPCQDGISCQEKYFEFFNFINIPFLSMIGFIVITICMFIFLKTHHKYEN